LVSTGARVPDVDVDAVSDREEGGDVVVEEGEEDA
jgi:hypothetical protein